MPLINGRKIAAEVLSEIKSEVKSRNLNLRLDAIIVGDDPALAKFVELKKKAGATAGVKVVSHAFSETTPEEEILHLINQLSLDPEVNGIFIELPMPKRFNASKFTEAIPSEKDVDALASETQVLPPAVLALQILLDKENISLQNKTAAVFGQGRLVGRPISDWLESQGVKVARIDINTPNPKELSIKTDLVVAGVGKPSLITPDMVKEGAVVVDFGYGKKDGKMMGDVSSDVADKASLTPVPGGMGPLVIAAVFKSLLELNK